MSALHQSLAAGQVMALTQGQAIHGLGGVGKTQIALEYAYRHAAEYTVVWWMRSEEPITLKNDFAGLANDLNLPEKDQPEQQIIVDAVKRWLRVNRGWLLIFDNATDSDSLREYIPTGSGGHILVTSRNANWDGVIRSLPVERMKLEEATEFLLSRTGLSDEAAAELVAKELDCLPLALEQAGAYIKASSCTLAHYLKLFQTRQQVMMGRGKPSTEYPATIATTWEMAFQEIEVRFPTAIDLLRLCAFFAPDDITEEMIRAGAEHLPESLAAVVSDDIAFDAAIAALRRYSLIKREEGALSVHRLVQAVTRHRLSKEAFKQWAETAIAVVNRVFPDNSDDVRTWEVIERLLPHATMVAESAEAIKSTTEQTSRLLNQLGGYFLGRADYSQAKAHFERALAIDEQAYGAHHPEVAIRVNNLGMVLKALGDLAGARAHFERALAIDEQAYGAHHPEVATDVNNLGMVLKALGDLAGARAHYERALAIGEEAYGNNHPQVATFANNLGGVLQDLGDLAGARAHFERALAIDEQAYGKHHPTVAIRVNNLGMVLQALGDLAGARAHFERALAIVEKALGDTHPYVANCVNNLGLVLQDLGDLAGARAHFERALGILREFFNEEHPYIKIVKAQLESLGK